MPPPSPHSSTSAAPALTRRLRKWWWLLPGVLTMAAWLWLRTDTEAAAPQTRAQSLLQQAAEALAHGHLSAPDGSGARELYEAAQAIDPDLPQARRGRVEVGLAALARARAELVQGDIPAAQRDLALARQLQVPRAEWEQIADALRQHALAEVNLEGLLEHADTARVQGWLIEVPPEFPGQSPALPLYQHILTLQPGHAAALRGRDDALAQLLDDARAALRTGDLETAAATIASVRARDPGHVDLPDTLARLTEECAALQRQAERELARGQVELAVAGWQRLLALNPDDPEARSGIERAVQALAERAATLGEALEFDQAEHLLAHARELAPSSPALHTAEVRIARARQGQQEATPAASLRATGDCFEASLAANNLGRARECLDAARAQGEAVDTLNARRRQLALRWIAIGEERLRSGNLPAAAAALDTARATDPATPGLHGLARRIETAER